MQRWDRRSSQRVDAFAADSRHIARKIEMFWGRQAETIYPHVDVERFVPDGEPPDDFFLVVSALVPYKKIDRAIAAARMAKVKLVIVGDGPERERLEGMGNGQVEFMGWVSDQELPRYYQRARALLYPGTEDFGITALEAQACGRPVLALRSGGATETVADGVSGAFFEEPSAKSLARLLRSHKDDAYDSRAIRRHAEQFSPEAFRSALTDWISKAMRFAA
jgi:glycosyltransferase involved in cell wall biosynthesis